LNRSDIATWQWLAVFVAVLSGKSVESHHPISRV